MSESTSETSATTGTEGLQPTLADAGPEQAAQTISPDGEGEAVAAAGHEGKEGQEGPDSGGSETGVAADSGDSAGSAGPGGSAGSADEDQVGPQDGGARGESGLTRREHLEREGDVAADFLETLMDIADLDGDIDVDIDGDRPAVSIVDSEDGRVPRRLVGPDGRVLEALQELTRLAVQSSIGVRSRMMLDVAGFRAERRAMLVALARAAVERAKDGSEPVDLEPMSAFERKVVHDEVLAQGLASESHGTEPRRHVTVLPPG